MREINPQAMPAPGPWDGQGLALPNYLLPCGTKGCVCVRVCLCVCVYLCVRTLFSGKALPSVYAPNMVSAFICGQVPQGGHGAQPPSRGPPSLPWPWSPSCLPQWLPQGGQLRPLCPHKLVLSRGWPLWSSEQLHRLSGFSRDRDTHLPARLPVFSSREQRRTLGGPGPARQ